MRSVIGWALNEACRQLNAWQRQGLPPVPAAVNVSPTQFLQKDFSRDVARTLADNGVAPKCIHLELSEAAVMSHLDEVVAILNDLKQLGVEIAIDEFGHGYTSLEQLSQLPIHSLKVNALNPNRAFNDTISTLGQNMGFDIIAERIETEGVLEAFRLRKYGKVQGFHLCRPLSGDDFADWYLHRAAA